MKAIIRKTIIYLYSKLKESSLVKKINKSPGNNFIRRNKTKLSNILVNRFRIPRILVPVEELRKKYEEALRYLINKNGINSLGDYLEFGVYQGTSLLCMIGVAKDSNLKNIRYFGFDSFEGLPAPTDLGEVALWSKEGFKADYEFTREILTKANVDWNRTFLIKGFFSSTLNKNTIDENKLTKASIIMIDCDMYSSAKEALNFCIPFIQDDAIVFFDDWNCTDSNGGEKKAFSEFLKENPNFRAEEFGTYCSNAQVFRVYRI